MEVPRRSSATSLSHGRREVRAPQAPGVVTPDPRIVLAGDGIRCALPVALMERAATTGWLAADELLRGWGVAGHGVWTVPVRHRHRVVPLLRRAARRLDRSGQTP